MEVKLVLEVNFVILVNMNLDPNVTLSIAKVL
jgi:hypothetical protein